MSILSNDEFVSPTQRVLLPMEDENVDERMSFVFYFYPEYNAKIPKPKSNWGYRLLQFITGESDTEDKGKSLRGSFDLEMSFGDYIKQQKARASGIPPQTQPSQFIE